MKRLFGIILALGFSHLSAAQVTLENISLTYPELNILHRGQVDTLKVIGSAKGIAYQLLPGDHNVKISKISQNKFEVVADSGFQTSIDILLNGKKIQSENYSIRKLLTPDVKFSNGDSTASIDEIISKPKLWIVDPRYGHVALHISSFEAYMITDSGRSYLPPYDPDTSFVDSIYTKSPITLNDTIVTRKITNPKSMHTRGNKLTSYQLKEVAKLNQGDTLVFRKIKIRSLPYDSQLGSLFITIK